MGTKQESTLDPATAGISYLRGVTAEGASVLAAKARFNAQDYGVKPANSAATNSANLQTLSDLAYAQTYGGSIFFPAGLYSFDPADQVTFPKASGKSVELVGEHWGTVFNVGSSTTNTAFYIGSGLSANTVDLTVRNIKFVGGSTTTGQAFTTEWANGLRFKNCSFSTMKNVALMTSCYGVIFEMCQFENVGGANVYSTTHCHHLVFDRCGVYNAGVAGTAQFIHIDAGHTDNLVIRDSVFEGCRQIIRADDGLSAFIFEGNYTEYCVTDPFDFGTGVYGNSMSNNWLALGSSFSFANWTGGEFSRNRLFDQTITFGSTCTDVHIADNRITGTSVLTSSAMMHAPSMLNSATSDATYPVKYSKSDGIVQLHGKVNNCPGGGSPVFSLPAGYRPLQTGQWGASRSSTQNDRVVVIDASNGNVVPSSSLAESVYLDGIMFRVAN